MTDKPTIEELLARLGDCAVLLNNGDVSKLENIGWFGELRTAITALEKERDELYDEVDGLRYGNLDLQSSLKEHQRVLGELVNESQCLNDYDIKHLSWFNRNQYKCIWCGKEYPNPCESDQWDCDSPTCPAVQARALLATDATPDMTPQKRERIITNLKKTADKVAKWPAWQRNVLGPLKSGTTPDERLEEIELNETDHKILE